MKLTLSDVRPSLQVTKFTVSLVRKPIKHADTELWMACGRLFYPELRTSRLLWYSNSNNNNYNNENNNNNLCTGVKLGRSHWGKNVVWGCFENIVLREVFLSTGDEVTQDCRRHIISSLMICTAHQMKCGWSNRQDWDGRGMWKVWVTGKLQAGFWWADLRERCQLEEPRPRWEDNIKWIFSNWDRGHGLDWSGSR